MVQALETLPVVTEIMACLPPVIDQHIAAHSSKTTRQRGDDAKIGIMITGDMRMRKKVLLSSVYRPFAVDTDDSRKMNPLELFHNQVTKAQGPFSLRMNHRSASLLFIAHNISADTTVLDTPTYEEFCREITEHSYDYIGITSIIMNFKKAKRMVEAAKRLSPQSQVVLGSHITAFREIEKHIPADHFVRGDGIAWFRKEIGDDPDAPVRHPSVVAHYGAETMGISIPNVESAWLVPGLGCPHHCDFCATSDFFDGYISILKTGKEMFDVCLQVEKDLNVDTFFILDENFMGKENRVKEFLALMKKHNKPWKFSIFSSLSALKKYPIDLLLELGVNAIWIGLESKFQPYAKQKGLDDPKAYIRELKKNGISVLGSTIIGVPDHTPDKVLEEIDHALSYGTDLHQFMLYTPLPTTPLWKKTEAAGCILPGIPWEDQHGQYRFNWRHPHITAEESEKLVQLAFDEDYRRLGPSLFRIGQTRLNRLKSTLGHESPLIQARNKEEIARMGNLIPLVWAMEKYFTFSNPGVKKKIKQVRKDMQRFMKSGTRSKARTMVVGSVLLGTTLYSYLKRILLKVPKEPVTIREVVNHS